MNPNELRRDFPALDQQVNGHPLVYLDNGATSQRPSVVIDEIKRFYEEDNANVHRSVHTLGERATALYEGAREKLAELIGAGTRELIFTKSATEALNLVAYAWGRHHLKEGDEVLVTEMEHHSNIVSWQLACKDTGAVLKAIPVLEDGLLDMKTYESMLGPRTKVVAVAHVSNVLGTINPVAEVSRLAHDAGAVVCCDGAQAVPHMPVDVAALGCDFYAGTGHKMCAPTGIGFLWGREQILEEMEPFMGGGEMILDVWIDHATYNDLPYKFEAGTPPIAGAVGLGAAIDYLNGIGMKAIHDHEMELTKYAMQRMTELPGAVVYGPTDPEVKAGLVSFTLGEIHAHDVGTFLDSKGVAIRVGHHCARPLMRKLGVPATGRASFYLYNTTDDVDRMIDALFETQKLFGGGGIS
ncbi:MAG TPA: cysteine desulfurase [Actinomycetota bacterium]|nr:cysteine desulfurase [Actinomycetota bacterium]